MISLFFFPVYSLYLLLCPVFLLFCRWLSSFWGLFFIFNESTICNTRKSRIHQRKCSIKKSFSLKSHNIHRKTSVLVSVFVKVAGQIFKTTYFKNICKRLLLKSREVPIMIPVMIFNNIKPLLICEQSPTQRTHHEKSI